MSNKRSIFEDVGSDVLPGEDTPKAGMIDRAPKGTRRAIRGWLMLVFALVALMLMADAASRLMVPDLMIAGVPPATRLGCLSFGVWAVGFVFFLLGKKIPAGAVGRLTGLGVLSAILAASAVWPLGAVALRLAVTFGAGFAVLGGALWYIFLLSRSEAEIMQARRGREGRLFSLSSGLMYLAFVQILLGALLAGIDAGRGYTDWPLMGGQLIPDGMFDIAPWWRNFVENPALVQFSHRLAGYLLLIFVVVAWWRARGCGSRKTKAAFNMLLVMGLLQVVLGITTVMLAAQPHVTLTHLFGAILLWGMILRARFLAGYPVAQSVRG